MTDQQAAPPQAAAKRTAPKQAALPQEQAAVEQAAPPQAVPPHEQTAAKRTVPPRAVPPHEQAVAERTVAPRTAPPQAAMEQTVPPQAAPPNSAAVEPAAPRPAVPRRSRLTAEQRRESILVAAMEVFAQTGYQRGTTAAVARRVGVSEPVIFQNFGTKAALFAAVVRRAGEHACEWLAQLVAQHETIAGLVHAVLTPGHLHHIHAPGSVGALLAEASSMAGEAEIEAAARDATRQFGNALADVFEDGRRSGELQPDLDVDAAAWWMLSLVASHRFRHANVPDPANMETRLADATMVMLTGVARVK